MPHGSREIDFRSLDQRTRAVALVGRYLQLWALMEMAIDDAIAKISKMDNIQNWVLSANIQFHSKINILNTLLDLSKVADREKKKLTDKLNDMAAAGSGER